MKYFKFLDDKSSDTMNISLEVPINPDWNEHFNNLSYQLLDPSYPSECVPVNFMFEWVNQHEYREFTYVRIQTFYGNIVDFSRWYDLMRSNLPSNEYLPNYPPIYQIRTSFGNSNYMNGNVNLLPNQQIVTPPKFLLYLPTILLLKLW